MKDEFSNQLKRGLILLENNIPAIICDLKIEINGDKVHVYGWSQYYYIESLNKKVVINELNIIKNTFYSIVERSKDFKNYIENKNKIFYLLFEDGKNSIAICREENGDIKWMMDI